MGVISQQVLPHALGVVSQQALPAVPGAISQVTLYTAQQVLPRVADAVSHQIYYYHLCQVPPASRRCQVCQFAFYQTSPLGDSFGLVRSFQFLFSLDFLLALFFSPPPPPFIHHLLLLLLLSLQ